MFILIIILDDYKLEKSYCEQNYGHICVKLYIMVYLQCYNF